MLTKNTEENRQKIIAWINRQFQFRAKSLYEYMNTTADTKLAQFCRVIIQAGKIKGYIQQVEKGKYILLKSCPMDMKGRTVWKLTKREIKYGKDL